MILNINKPKNITSRDVINQLNKILNTKKIGHTGTLDPLATGVLIVCTHEDTKFFELLTSKEKEYIATIKLGIKTDTGDITGQILEEKEFDLTENKIIKVLNSFLGKSVQIVPKYSAVKINGKKLYEYARENIDINLPEREIEIFNIEFIEYHNDLIKFKVLVSKGTYIRSLIEDICLKLNTIGTMEDLIRTRQGNFNLKDSSNLEDIQNNNFKVIRRNEILKDYPFEQVTPENYLKIKNGAIIDKDFDTLFKVYTNTSNEIIAIYQEYEKDRSKAKPYRMFQELS